MKQVLRSIALVLAVACALPAQFHLPGLSGNSSAKPDAPMSNANTTPSSRPAVEKAPAASKHFEYYALSLGWSAGRIAVKGLAPQVNHGTNAESCGSVKPASKGAMSIVASIMPDRNAVQQEWMKHGSCTGLTAAEYFNTIRFTRSLVQIPVQLTSPDVDAAQETAKGIEDWFAGANPGFPAGAFRAGAAEVEVCFDLQLKPQACPTGSK